MGRPLLTAALRLWRAGDPSAVVTCYHALSGPASPSAATTSVSAALFSETLDSLTALCRVVPLGELIARHRAGRSIRDLAAITFDDAYRSVADLALPVLKARGLPATLFVVADAASSGEPFWWDRVEDASVRAGPEAWRAFETACGAPPAWPSGADRPAFTPMRQWVLGTHRGRWPAELAGPLASLEAQAGGRTAQRPMTWVELADIMRDPLFTIGVHTRTHPVLPLLSQDELADEVAGAFRTLCDRLGLVLPVLAIPYGLYDRPTAQGARALGMEACLSISARVVRGGGEDPIPRFCMLTNRRGVRWRLQVSGMYDRIRALLGRGEPDPPPLPPPPGTAGAQSRAR
jgi:peptidoglycan/xylan/chitin deacetylase (PgdA/CDA1 family)